MTQKTRWYNEIEGTFCVLIMIFMLVILFYQVVARYLFGASSAAIDELSRYSLVWLAYVSTVYATIHNVHIKIEMFLNVWPKSWRRPIKLFGNVLFFVYCAIVTYYSAVWLIGLANTGTITLGLRAPMAIIICIIPISHFVMAVRVVQLQIKMIKDPRSTDDPHAAKPVAHNVEAGGAK